MKEVELLKDKLDDHIAIEEFERIVEELEYQAKLNDEIDKANRYFVKERIKLNKESEKLKLKVNQL